MLKRKGRNLKEWERERKERGGKEAEGMRGAGQRSKGSEKENFTRYSFVSLRALSSAVANLQHGVQPKNE